MSPLSEQWACLTGKLIFLFLCSTLVETVLTVKLSEKKKKSKSLLTILWEEAKEEFHCTIHTKTSKYPLSKFLFPKSYSHICCLFLLLLISLFYCPQPLPPRSYLLFALSLPVEEYSLPWLVPLGFVKGLAADWASKEASPWKPGRGQRLLSYMV